MVESAWNKRVRESLPPIEENYPDNQLSSNELAALEVTMRDGFGDVGSPTAWRGPLPAEIRSGVLHHQFYVHTARPDDLEDEEYKEWRFWDHDDDDRPAAFESFPLGFSLETLTTYFERQKARYLWRQRQRAPFPGVELGDEWSDAEFRLYEKPWYEHHALQLLSFIALTKQESERRRKAGKTDSLGAFLMLQWCGVLGRLVEQYYWRFRFEAPVISGLAVRQAASAGGTARALAHKLDHAKWSAFAQTVWARRPDLSKLAVAGIVRRQFNLRQSTKHIARFIARK
ncbi:MAG: hypothetical protein IT535_10115 [Bauldia sp.]|nr:hypothetical protein [Bauldia sp.]